MVVINLCQCVLPGVRKGKEDAKDLEEAVALLQQEMQENPGSAIAKIAGLEVSDKKASKKADLMTTCNRVLDMFKGMLVIFMTWAHVDLTLMQPVLQTYGELPHFVGNAASGLCFLGFMTAYGFCCDNAYLSDYKKRSFAQRMERLARSALMPVFGAWVCAFGWAYLCFKLPLDIEGAIRILDFRLAIGNGPDFLLCFTTCLCAMYPLRGLVNKGLNSEYGGMRVFTAAMLLLLPLVLTQVVVPDCSGLKKYLGYVFVCHVREPYSPVLPGLPHLFYFNLGVLLSRYIKALSADLKAGADIDNKRLVVLSLSTAALFAVLCYPLATVWNYNYGNLYVQTQWGVISRGFSDGPSPLWLVGNLFPIYVVMAAVFYIYHLVEWHPVMLFPVRLVLEQLEHLGANVLMYLVVGDLCCAGLWRGLQNEFPLDTHGCMCATLMIMTVVRFIHYLGASSRDGRGTVKDAGVSAG